MGFIKGHGLRFDRRTRSKSDYDISMQNALKHRYCFVDQRFAFQYNTSFVGGGYLGRRVSDEEEAIALLKKKWGDCIQIMSTSEGKDARLNRKKRSGVENIWIKLPY